MFIKSAAFYDKIYSWKDYASEAAQLHNLVQLNKQNEGVALLDVACGTGGHFPYLQTHYQLEGLDLDKEMLAVARERFPDVTFYHADMRNFDLGKSYDVITCLFSAIAYAVTLENLQQAMNAFYRHLNPGGVAIIEGFIQPEEFRPRHIGALFVDEPDLKISRMNRSDLHGNVLSIAFHYLVGTPERIDYFTEDHTLALFTDDEYLDAMRAGGFEAKRAETNLMPNWSLFIGLRPLRLTPKLCRHDV